MMESLILRYAKLFTKLIQKQTTKAITKAMLHSVPCSHAQSLERRQHVGFLDTRRNPADDTKWMALYAAESN